jgi:hypothetical protein
MNGLDGSVVKLETSERVDWSTWVVGANQTWVCQKTKSTGDDDVSRFSYVWMYE